MLGRTRIPTRRALERNADRQIESRSFLSEFSDAWVQLDALDRSQNDDQNVYLVVDDFGRNGRAWREAGLEATDLETVILDMLEGQYKNPVRVVGFNTAQGWSQDLSADVAQELRQRCDLQLRDVPFFLQDFVDRHEGRHHDVHPRLSPAIDRVKSGYGLRVIK